MNLKLLKMIVKRTFENSSLESESGLWTASKSDLKFNELKTGLTETQKNVAEPSEVNTIKDETASPILPGDIGTDFTFKRKIAWFNLIGMTLLHMAGVYGLFLACVGQVQWRTMLYGEFLIYFFY